MKDGEGTTPDDQYFYVLDRLGNKTAVNINEVDVEYTLAAKNIDGSKVVLNMTLPQSKNAQLITVHH